MFDPIPIERTALDPRQILRVHGLDLSYFTGKLEANLRIKGLRYELVEMDTRAFRTLGKRMGIAQMPHLELPDGQLLTDTTHILRWLDQQVPAPALRASDPALCWIGDLLEDFGDEWLWRPALYYRWAFPEDARLMSDRIAQGMLRDIPAPLTLRRTFIRLRQQHVYLRLEGVTKQNARAIEGLYLETLAALEEVLGEQPFLLGEYPSQADLGFFGPFFRHFSSDPTPSRILRARAPAVMHWVARMWDHSPNDAIRTTKPVKSEQGLPDGLGPLLRLVCLDYLPYLAANEDHWLKGQRWHQWHTHGAEFRTPVNPYRVWCWQTLRQEFQQLPVPDRRRVMTWLAEACGSDLQRMVEPLLDRVVPDQGMTALTPWQQPQSIRAGTQLDRQWRAA